MKYKMIVTDIDDTLVDNQKRISKVDRDAIIKAQENGIKFVLASGRVPFAMEKMAKELELDKYGGYILGFNGSIAIDFKTNKTLYEVGLKKQDIYDMFDFSQKYKTEFLTYQGDEMVFTGITKYTEAEIKIAQMKYHITKDIKNYIYKDCIKCMLIDEPTHLADVEKELRKEYSDKYSIALSKPFFLEVFLKEINKGIAMLKLGDMLGIKKEEIIAIGDSYNDKEMLEMAGTSVAVANANDDIKNIVDYVTASNENGGISQMINKFIFGKE